MMSSAQPLVLTCEQASRLQAYLQTYRRYTFVAHLPGVDRNTTLRTLQTMQGRLIDALDQKTAPFRLALTVEEMATLQTITTELLLLYAKGPASEQRNGILTDLAGLKTCLRSS
jgi:hypothetical protein